MADIMGKKPGWISRFSDTPLSLRLAGLCSAFLLAGFFLPSLTLTLQSRDRMRLSILQVLQSGAMRIPIDGVKHTLSFAGAVPYAVLAFVLPFLALAAAAAWPFLIRKMPRFAPAGIVSALLAGDLAALFLLPARMVPPAFYADAGIATADLYFSPALFGNLMILAAIFGAGAALFSASGLKVRLRQLTYPYFLWLIVFTILPLLLIFFSAFFAKNTDGSYAFTLDGFRTLSVNRIVETEFYGLSMRLQEYFAVFLRSLDYSVCTTVGCLLVAYPLAYVLAGRAKRTHTSSSLLLMFFVLPMWINTMLRTYAWRAFFGPTGVLNSFLTGIGLISDPILFLKLDFVADLVIKLVLVNDFLPFMLLPIYSVLVKIDDNVRQAAHDLGANNRQTFTRVTFPLSLPGVISGIQMVFMPSLTFYMIPDIISEGSVTTIGMTVQTFILSESPVQQQAGNVLSLLLLVFVLITMGVLRNSDKDYGGGGMVL